MFSCHKENKASTNRSHIFSSSDIVSSYYMTLSRGYCLERNKDSSSFRTYDDTIIVLISLFRIFLLLTLISFYLSLEICFLEIWSVLYMSIFYVTLKLFPCFILPLATFLEWSRYLTIHILLGVL